MRVTPQLQDMLVEVVKIVVLDEIIFGVEGAADVDALTKSEPQ